MSKKYDMTSDKDEEDSVHSRAIKKIDELRQLDESNPLERAVKFNMVRKHPPKPDFMKIDVSEGEDENGNRIAVSESKGFKGKVKRIIHPPFMSINLNTLIAADVAACPSNIMPMLIHKYVQVDRDERKIMKPKDKRRDEFNWWWIVFFLLMIPGILVIIWSFL